MPLESQIRLEPRENSKVRITQHPVGNGGFEFEIHGFCCPSLSHMSYDRDVLNQSREIGNTTSRNSSKAMSAMCHMCSE